MRPVGKLVAGVRRTPAADRSRRLVKVRPIVAPCHFAWIRNTRMTSSSTPSAGSEQLAFVREHQARFDTGQQFWFAIEDHTLVWCLLFTVTPPTVGPGVSPSRFLRWFLHWNRRPAGFEVVRDMVPMSDVERANFIARARTRVL